MIHVTIVADSTDYRWDTGIITHRRTGYRWEKS